MIYKTKTISYENKARFFWILTTISVLAFFAYMYAIAITAKNTAFSQNLEKQTEQLSTTIDSLEFTLLELKNNITIELAYEHGFKEIKNPLYVSRVQTATLSFNTLD